MSKSVPFKSLQSDKEIGVRDATFNTVKSQFFFWHFETKIQIFFCKRITEINIYVLNMIKSESIMSDK